MSRLQQPRPKAAVCENAETWPFGNVFLLGGQDAWVCKSQFIADRLMVPDGPNGHLLHAVGRWALALVGPPGPCSHHRHGPLCSALGEG